MKPPESCGFDINTGEDMFCCSDLNGQSIKEPQKPLFTKNGKPYPCLDQTSHCDRWMKTNPKSCSPYYKDGYIHNSYPFMREVCQESCRKITPNFRSNKCDKVSAVILHF